MSPSVVFPSRDMRECREGALIDEDAVVRVGPLPRLEAAPTPGRRHGSAVGSGFGQTLITIGVLVLLLCMYEVWFTGLSTARDQSRLSHDLKRTWAQSEAPAVSTGSAPLTAAPPPVPPLPVPPLPVPPGSAFARLYLPTLWGDHDLVIVEGVGVSDLKRGPGHLPGSAAPGQLGNMVLSGHRTTYGAPFADLDHLRVGDPVVVQTRDAWVTYRVQDVQIVDPTDVGVVLPVPRRPGVEPVAGRFTLTTCNPRYSARQRLVVSGALQSSSPVVGPRPAVLGA